MSTSGSSNAITTVFASGAFLADLDKNELNDAFEIGLDRVKPSLAKLVTPVQRKVSQRMTDRRRSCCSGKVSLSKLTLRALHWKRTDPSTEATEEGGVVTETCRSSREKSSLHLLSKRLPSILHSAQGLPFAQGPSAFRMIMQGVNDAVQDAVLVPDGILGRHIQRTTLRIGDESIGWGGSKMLEFQSGIRASWRLLPWSPRRERSRISKTNVMNTRERRG